MYIKINNMIYPCLKPKFAQNILQWHSINNLSFPVSDIIYTCRDDGFVMREDDPTDWAYQYYEDNVLVLTNVEKVIITPNIEDVKNTKNTELSNVCNQLIYDGMDITLSDSSTKHFTYTLQDQANISEMFTAVMAGATQYPYHADDEGCEIYSAQDIITIYSTLSGMKTAQITYQNQLKQYVKSLESIEDIQAVTYGQELTGQYLETYNTLVNEAKAQLQTILSKVTTVLSE